MTLVIERLLARGLVPMEMASFPKASDPGGAPKKVSARPALRDVHAPCMPCALLRHLVSCVRSALLSGHGFGCWTPFPVASPACPAPTARRPGYLGMPPRASQAMVEPARQGRQPRLTSGAARGVTLGAVLHEVWMSDTIPCGMQTGTRVRPKAGRAGGWMRQQAMLACTPGRTVCQKATPACQ